jgi:hypothetical protein
MSVKPRNGSWTGVSVHFFDSLSKVPYLDVRGRYMKNGFNSDEFIAMFSL